MVRADVPANWQYRLATGAAATPLAAFGLILPDVGWAVAGVLVVWAIGESSRTGIYLGESEVTIRNFGRRFRSDYEQIEWIGIEELDAGRVMWRMSSSLGIRIQAKSGSVGRSYCVTDGPRLVPAPSDSPLYWAIDEIQRRRARAVAAR